MTLQERPIDPLQFEEHAVFSLSAMRVRWRANPPFPDATVS